MADPNLAEDRAVTVGNVFLEANHATVTKTALVTTAATLVSDLLIMYCNLYVR